MRNESHHSFVAVHHNNGRSDMCVCFLELLDLESRQLRFGRHHDRVAPRVHLRGALLRVVPRRHGASRGQSAISRSTCAAIMTRIASPWARIKGGGRRRSRAVEGGKGGSSKPGPTCNATTRSAGILLATSRPSTARRPPSTKRRPSSARGGK